MKLLKKMSFTKQESQESNSVITEDGGSQVANINPICNQICIYKNYYVVSNAGWAF